MSLEVPTLSSLLNLALSSTSDFAQIFDREGRLLYANQALLHLWGLRQEDAVGKEVTDLGYSRDFAARLKSELAEVIASGLSYTGETAYQDPTGLSGWYEYVLSPIIGEDGKPQFVYGSTRDVTSRRNRHQAELNEVSDLRAALNAHAIHAITDPMGRITFVNDKFCAISKYSRDELLGQDHRIINSGHHPREFFRDLWNTISKGQVWQGDIKNRAKDGSIYWVATTIVPFLNPDGKPRQYVAIRADITEQKRAEEQLQASLTEVSDLRAALDEHAIVAITDPVGRINFVNDKFCAISKYSREELIGQDHRIINSGHHPREFFRDLWNTISQGQVWQGEIKNRAKDGSIYWVATTIVPFLNPDGKPRQYVAIRADITERKRTEEAFRESEDLFSKAFHLSPDAMVIVRASDRTVIRANEALCKLWGITIGEVVGKPGHEFANWVNDEDRDTFRRTLAEKGECLGFETQIRMSHGAVLYFSISSRMITLGGEPCILTVKRNIDDRFRAEQAIQQLNAELELRVAQRTRQLEEANHELEAFSYSISHDLRTPLRAMDGFSHAVLDDYGPLLPPEGVRYLQTIRDAAQKMGILIDDLLTFSRLSRASLQTQTVPTAKLVQSVVEEVQSLHPDRAVNVEIGVLPDCQGDAALLRQVWVNLITNAFKYTGKRERALVQIGSDSGPEGTTYWVKDNGIGFDMRYAKNLFGVFQRLHRVEDYPGTGVGLAIVQRIIHRHAGRVWAEASPNEGAAFFFTIQEAE